MRRSSNAIAETPGMGRELLVPWIGLGIAIGCALLAGYWVGTSNLDLLVMSVMLVIMTLVILGLRQRVWVLVPIFWAFAGGSAMLRIPFSVHDVTVMMAFCGYCAYLTLSKKDTRHPWNGLDWILFLNVIYLVGTYLLHPVGMRAMGATDIGGRPYFNIALAVLSYRLLARMPDSPKTVSRIPLFLAAGASAITFMNVVAYLIPSLTPVLYFVIGNVDVDPFIESMVGGESIGRFKGLANFGQVVIPVLCAYYPPITWFDIRRARFYLVCIAMYGTLVSGFRGLLMRTMLAIGVGSFLQRGWRGVVQITLIGGVLLSLLVLGHGRFFELPFSVQRTLTFLPGDWALEAKADAESSTQWRVDMWKYVIEHRVIQNWWFGDGFAVRPSDLPAIGLRGTNTDNALVSGGYHNGPLSTIRFVGIVGLVLFYALMLASTYYSYKAVRLCRGTIFQPLAFFLAIWCTLNPLLFTTIFGAYNESLPEQIFYTALLRLTLRMAENLSASRSPGVSVRRVGLPTSFTGATLR